MHYLKFVINLQQNGRMHEEVGRCTIEMCLSNIALALSMVTLNLLFTVISSRYHNIVLKILINFR